MFILVTIIVIAAVIGVAKAGNAGVDLPIVDI
jgi:hypothetical protein